jgi:hypothetical protein
VPTSEIRIISDASDRTVMMDPRIIYRPTQIRGRHYVVIAEEPEDTDENSSAS